MNCPACERILKPVHLAGAEFDVCDGGCGGIWFDWFEFEKVDEQSEVAGESLLEVERDSQIQLDQERRRNCPRCEDIVMSRKFHSVKRSVEIDECQVCGGIFLDAGELAQIRDMFETTEEREKAAEAYFSDVFNRNMSSAIEAQEETSDEIKKRKKILRFFCPSIWLGLFDD